MLSELRYKRAWGALLALYVVALAVSSLLPGSTLAPYSFNDKLEHLLAYLVLVLLGCGMVPPRRYLLVMLASLAIGLLMELAQAALTASREGDWHDLVADGLGISIAGALAWLGAGGWALHAERWLGRLFRR